MNIVCIIGRLTREPEIRHTQDGTAVGNFTVAVDRRKAGEHEADFFNCTAWGKTAEFVEKYIHKGTKICIRGRLQIDTYTDKQGQKRSSVAIIAEEIEFAESKASGQAAPSKPAEAPDADFMKVPESTDGEELPFI